LCPGLSGSALSRPHLTLNPYSTQLVDNINLMMPNTRTVSPSAHLYWEIDPAVHANYVITDTHHASDVSDASDDACARAATSASGTASSTASRARMASGSRFSELRPLIEAQPRPIMRTSNSIELGAPSMAVTSTFVRTGAGRVTATNVRKPAAVSNCVPEQVQQQVQIRDLRSIQVPVKSSEYIEAKIRTLKNSRVA
jgi:hypothetical protein